jgi:flagellar basal-body rod protein FlgB
MPGPIEHYLRFQSDALQLRAQRQQLIASNIANADTPGYKAVDFDFARALRESVGGSSVAQRTSAPGHMTPRHQSEKPAGGTLVEDGVLQPAQDGNTVDMDKERARFAENAVRYEATLKFLNGQIRALLSAIQGQ